MAPFPGLHGAAVAAGVGREAEVEGAHADGEAKFWLTPQVSLANQTGLSVAQIRQAQAIVIAHLKEIQDAWHHHFGS